VKISFIKKKIGLLLENYNVFIDIQNYTIFDHSLFVQNKKGVLYNVISIKLTGKYQSLKTTTILLQQLSF
jgi:hypothetical protein